MGDISKKHQRLRGFTVTELLIAISIIGILVSIVVVLYPGYQKRTRDAERKSDVGQVAGALGTYAFQKNNFVDASSGCGLSGNGWLAASSAQIAGYAPKSILTCLQEAGILEGGTFIDPSGCLWASPGACAAVPVRAYMKASCQKSGVPIHYVLAYLESDPQKVAEVDALCDNGSVAGFTSVTQKWGTLYGMNYYVVVK